MNRILLKKSISESKWLFLACAVCLFAFCWIRVWIVSSLETGSFEVVIEQFWDKMEKFFPVSLSQLLTYSGRIAVTYDEPIVLLCMSVWTIARGSDCVSGELNRGTMEMVLAQPVNRVQVLFSQASVTVFGAGLLALIAWAGIWCGIHTTTIKETPPPMSWTIPGINLEITNPFDNPEKEIIPMSEKVEAKVFATASANLFFLGFFLAGFSALMSSWDRYRWRTIGIVVGFFVVQMILKLVGMAVDDMGWVAHFTFLTAYEPEAFVAIAARSPEETWSIVQYDQQGAWLDLGPLGYDLVLAVLGILSYFGAAIIFCRRDLPAPL